MTNILKGRCNMKYFKTASDIRLDKLVKNPAIKKEIAKWRRAHCRPFSSEGLKGCVAYFKYREAA